MNDQHSAGTDIATLRARLEASIAALDAVVVGFSAGVDSSVVLAAAVAALGERATAVTAVTETITEEDVALAGDVAARLGARHEWIEYSELAIDNYAANPANRDFLYYVVKPGTCGEHAFSSTEAKFQQDVQRYNSAREAAGGNSPTTC